MKLSKTIHSCLSFPSIWFTDSNLPLSFQHRRFFGTFLKERGLLFSPFLPACNKSRAPERTFINLLKPTVYAMHQQFNIQQLYALPTLYLCVLYLSENKQRLVPLNSTNWLVFITEMKSVYSAVRTGSLNKAVCALTLKGQCTNPGFLLRYNWDRCSAGILRILNGF
jgi:hypothetical protein